MIKIHGAPDTQEHKAAQEIAIQLKKTWAETSSKTEHEVHLITGAKCHGQKVRDIDILLLAFFDPPLEFHPFLQHCKFDGTWELASRIFVESLCLNIELKEHSPNGVRFKGSTAEVCYGKFWKNVSEQSHEQTYSIKNFIKYHGVSEPYILSLIWLKNIPQSELPRRPHNLLGAGLTWDLLLNVANQIYPSKFDKKKGGYCLNHFHQSSFLDVKALFLQELQPTDLDLKRLNRITQYKTDALDLYDKVGYKFIILRGRGGTGKTLCLLQLAYRLYEQRDARVLLLTYNKALVADIRRMLTFMGIPDDIASKSIQITTVHAFFSNIFNKIGLTPKTNLLEDFEELKNFLLEYVRSDLLSASDIKEEWDYIFIDEAQDWPDNERELLSTLVGTENLVISDGIDQLVRSIVPADWRKSISKTEKSIVPLEKSFRMKANLAHFVSRLATELDYNLHIEPCTDANGGHIVILEKQYLLQKDFHEQLIKKNAADGNSEVDMLFCVPPKLVKYEDDTKWSIPARMFKDWGHQVWDGASVNVRESYPISSSEIRIVQYDSCRGLEGWIVVNFMLDEFYDYKYRMCKDESFATDDEKHLYVVRWLLIPLTRAIDTLVIELCMGSTPLRTALKRVAETCPDFVEWRT